MGIISRRPIDSATLYRWHEVLDGLAGELVVDIEGKPVVLATARPDVKAVSEEIFAQYLSVLDAEVSAA